MAVKKTTRLLWWAGLGGAAVLAAVNLSRDERDTSPMANKLAARDIPALSKDLEIAESLALPPERLRRGRQFGKMTGEPFAAQEPVRPALPAAALPTVVVPAFPYSFGGQLNLRGEETRVYLSLSGQLIPLKEGEALDGGFKVISVGADSVEVLHEPSGNTLRVLYASLGGSAVPVLVDSGPPATSANVTDAGATDLQSQAGNVKPLRRLGGRLGAPLQWSPGGG